MIIKKKKTPTIGFKAAGIVAHLRYVPVLEGLEVRLLRFLDLNLAGERRPLLLHQGERRQKRGFFLFQGIELFHGIFQAARPPPRRLPKLRQNLDMVWGRKICFNN